MLAPNTDLRSILQADAGTRRKRLSRRPLIWLLIALAAIGGLLWWTRAGERIGAHLQDRTGNPRRADHHSRGNRDGPADQSGRGRQRALRHPPYRQGGLQRPGRRGRRARRDRHRQAHGAGQSRPGALDAARANVTQGEATVTETRTDLDRMTVLVGRSSSTLKDLQAAQAAYDRAVAALASAKAQVKVAEADLSSNETELGKAVIRSPISGIVLSRNVDPGQTVAATLQAPVLFTIAEDLAKMDLLVDVDEADAGSVKEGQEAVFTVEAYPDRKFRRARHPASFCARDGERRRHLQGRPVRRQCRLVAAARNDGDRGDHNVARRPDALLVPNGALRYARRKPRSPTTARFLQRLMPRPPVATAEGREAPGRRAACLCLARRRACGGHRLPSARATAPRRKC